VSRGSDSAPERLAADPRGVPRIRTLADIDWAAWQPVYVATLLFVFRGDDVLLIRKKRGLGAGKINGPGGRVEPGETLLACAVREVEEEVGVTPVDPHWCGEHRFHFTDGFSLHTHVYCANAHVGEPVETDEAIPMWVARPELPYAEMWADDILWVPHMLAGRRFAGRFLFEGDQLLDHALVVEPLEQALPVAGA
jgi:8-oxo-dGTP diphosphatase